MSDWTCHGTAYRRAQDPRSQPGRLVDFYAPDCVQGNDGRYYLYYFAAGPNTTPFGPLSVAVAERPEGPFAYLGDVCHADGTPLLTYLTNDPAVLNDDGRVWLYYGWGLGRDFRARLLASLYTFVLAKFTHRPQREIRQTKPNILSCAVVELAEDMRTAKGAPRAVLDSKTTAPKDSALYRHAFYEAPSIRKFDGLYYLVYSSGENNELAYATSKYPDRDFDFRGVIVSGSDIGFQGNTRPRNNAGTIHGGIERIGGQTYIFYHRCTNNTDFSRQACAEPIEPLPDGTIRQAGLTSCGLNGAPLPGRGGYPAAICCHLTTPKPIRLGVGKQQTQPRITEQDGAVFLADLTPGTRAVYRYFDLRNTAGITVEVRGKGALTVNGAALDDKGFAPLTGGERETLCFEVVSGKVDVLSFTFKEFLIS